LTGTVTSEQEAPLRAAMPMQARAGDFMR
jgi:hypothetical protein